MGPSGEQPPEQPAPPQLAGESVHLEAHASGQARVSQAGRDLHVHHQDGVRSTRRIEAGTATQECPYPGLASFGREQARWFFGREALTAELTARLDARLATGGVQVVVAPSGAGKSSLLHAGLLPQLENDALVGSSRWPRMVFTPTAHPLAALATQVAALTGADPATLARELMADPHRAEAVLRGVLGREDSAGPVVVVDQFEELFTLCTDDQQRRAFIDALFQLADPRADGADARPVGLVVAGIRADFYAACANDHHLRTALQDSPLVVGPMSDTELREAILYPAQDVRLDVEEGLVELLLRDLGDTTADGSSYESGRLPLLAHALRATWQQRHGHTLTVEGYRATGGIPRAVATTAENVFTGLDPAGQRVAQTLFLRLIKIGDGAEDTRRRLPRTDLLRGLDRGHAASVVDAFTQGRLLTQDRDTVEITHEVLLRAWPRLCQWIDTDRADNLTRQKLEEAATDWERNHRDATALYRGGRLAAAREWVTQASHKAELSAVASEFLNASTRQEHRAARLRRTVVIVLCVLAFVASAGAILAVQQSRTARQERDTAIFNQITAQADRLRSTDASLAAQLDLTAYRMRHTPDLATDLIADADAPLSSPLTGHTGAVAAVAFSPDGRTLASGSPDGTVRLWNVSDPAHVTVLGAPLTSHTNGFSSVAFSPDGRTLASGGYDDTIRLWNVTDPTHATALGPALTGHTRAVTAVAFSPDGHTLASGGADDTVRLWNVSDPTHATALGLPLAAQTGDVVSVAFSPDGRTLASGGGGAVRLWNVSNPTHAAALGAPLTSHTAVYSVAFSPDGHTLASGGYNGVRLWNVSDPAHASAFGTPLTGHATVVSSVAFSPDGRILASGGSDGAVQLWNVTDPTQGTALGTPLTGHTNAVAAVAFSPDGHTLASGSNDHTVRLWSIPPMLVTGHAIVLSVALTPDGHTLASGSNDGTVQLWNVTDPTHPTALGELRTGHTSGVAVAFSPDGHTLATGSNDGTVRLWNVTDPTHPTAFSAPLRGDVIVFSVAFSPDGHTLASGGANGLRLWNVTDPTRPTTLGELRTGLDYPVAFSPDGHTLASGGADGTVRLWDVSDPAHATALGTPLTGHNGGVAAVAFSLDGRILASGGQDGTVRLWDVSDPAHATALGTPLTGHTNVVYSVAFSPDGHTLASGGADGTVRLWDVGDPVHATALGTPLTGHTNAVNSVAFSPDGHTLATGSADNTVRLWELNVDQAIQRICTTTTNTLTPAKWKQYISPDLPYQPPCP